MLLYFSPVSWHDFDQRPHEYVRSFNRVFGERVIWVEPYPTRLPKIGDLIARPALQEKKDVPEWLEIILPKALPIEPLPLINCINLLFFKKWLRSIFNRDIKIIAIGKPSAFALAALCCCKDAKKIYDAMDDFPHFYTGLSARSMAKVESSIVAKVDRISVSSHSLKEKFSYTKKPISLILNACSEKFRSLPLIHRKHNQLTLGYIGTVGAWFDWDLVVKLANFWPHAKVLIIGPLHKRYSKLLPSNIEIRPPVNHNQAVYEMCSFDIGLIPFLDTPLTRSVDPIKYYEYRACGLPIISTKFGEMQHRATEYGVYIVDSCQDFHFAAAIELDRINAVSLTTWLDRMDPFFRELHATF